MDGGHCLKGAQAGIANGACGRVVSLTRDLTLGRNRACNSEVQSRDHPRVLHLHRRSCICRSRRCVRSNREG